MIKRIVNIVLTAIILSTTPVIFAESTKGESKLIDVRELEEINRGMIKGASWLAVSDINSNSIRSEIFFEKLTRLGVKTVNLYCRSGNRVRKITPVFEAKGFKVNNLGGFSELLDRGFSSELAGLEDTDSKCEHLCL